MYSNEVQRQNSPNCKTVLRPPLPMCKRTSQISKPQTTWSVFVGLALWTVQSSMQESSAICARYKIYCTEYEVELTWGLVALLKAGEAPHSGSCPHAQLLLLSPAEPSSLFFSSSAESQPSQAFAFAKHAPH